MTRDTLPGIRRQAVILNALYACLLVVAAVVPRPVGPQGFMVSDSVAHGVAYGGQAFLLVWALRPLWGWPRSTVAAVGGAIAFGFFTEVVQLMLPYRDFSGTDVLADGIGAVAGVAVAAALRIGAIREPGGR